MSKSDLLMYWPRDDDVAACLKTDAEASSEAVSLAVHQPMRFERRIVGGDGDSLGFCTEHDVLRAFMADTLSDGRVILPIVGSTGIGKSHVVRWLYAQIQRMPGAEQRVVIRIPKGTSLKGVLGILLKEVQGKAYEAFRQELARAQEELEPSEAAGLLCEMLAHSLTEMGAVAREELLANPADKDAKERAAFCRADILPALLRNQLLRDQHFARTPDGGDGVIRRLVEQLTEGRAPGVEDDRQHQFGVQDLVFDDRIDRQALGRAESTALGLLDRDERRLVAVRILNSALDDAKQRLLRLDPTVSELFDAVRRELLKERKELILLVEDFAVLSGLQKQLLQVIIKEGVRDGRQELCTMRTALAYTTGYMETATVLTRANVEYRIPDAPGTEEEILSRVERLVGAYLNASRLGQSALEQAYRSRPSKSDDLGEWVSRFTAGAEPEERATLDAFGTSEDGYELFPFNRAAIRELAQEGSRRSGHLVFNPRFVIQNVINTVLMNRALFEQNAFPAGTFCSNGRKVPARVAEEVKQRVRPGEVERYLRFLVYWGGCPNSPAEITQAEPRVFSAFGFDSALFPRTSIPPSPPPAETRRQQATPVEMGRHVDPLEAKWDALLERWREGSTLAQTEANQLRKWVAEALKGVLERDWELFRPRRDGAVDSWAGSWIFIPRAAGHDGRGPDDAMVALCSDRELAEEATSARVQSSLMAVVRFHGVHKCNWDYDGAEDDLPRYAALLETLAPRARDFVRRRYFKTEWDPLATIVQGLLIGARALGLEGSARDADLPATIRSLFLPTPEIGPSIGATGTSTEGESTNWSEFVAVLRRCRGSAEGGPPDQLSWQDHLRNLVGARQGQGDAVHAIDVVRLKPAIDGVLRTWEFGDAPPSQVGASDLASFRATFTELKRVSGAIGKAQRRLFAWRKEFTAWLGELADKETLARELKETVEAAKAAGVAVGVDSRGALNLIEQFRTARVKAALEDTARLEETASRGTVLTILGRDYESVARQSEELRIRLDEFFGAVEDQLRGHAEAYGNDPMADAIGVLRTELLEAGRLLGEVPGA